MLSVPYRHQLNFTFDGLMESTNAIDRLRTFYTRIKDGKWPEEVAASLDGATESVADIIAKGDANFTAALGNDLNTSEARAAIFDVLRAINSAADQSAFNRANADATLALLAKFDSIFAVLEDKDGDHIRAALAWAESEGRMDEVSPEVLEKFGANSLTDADIDALVAERTLAKKQRNFAKSDAIRNELLEKGVILEDSKDGVRWKRK
jgi:cysteinyl-tRNA synthetase